MTSTALFLAAAGMGACGDDSDATSTTTTTSPPTSTTAGAEEVSTADPAAFCEAELAAEAAISSEAPDADAKTDAMLEAAPAEIEDAVEAALANAESGAGDPAFDEPYAEVMAFMVDECGAAEATLTLTDDGLEGPSSLDAGATVFRASNDGTAPRVTLLLAPADGTTAEDLVGVGPEEAVEAGTVLSGAFLVPGVSTSMIGDLAAGGYLIVSLSPEGDPTTAADVLELEVG